MIIAGWMRLLNPCLSLKESLLLIANTVGKGLSIAENKVEWHHKVPTLKQYEELDKELGLGDL